MIETAINRNNFCKHWFEDYLNKKHTDFNGFYLKEKDGIRDQIIKYLSDAMVDHHVHDKELKYLKTLGFEELAQGIKDNLPNRDLVKIGNFGEVISSEHLCQIQTYEMPVLKLRYMDTPSMPMRGEDIIAFKMENGEIKSICIGEAKTLGRYNGAKLKEAHEQLLDMKVSPISLSLITTILWDSNPDFAQKIKKFSAKLGLGNANRDNWIFILTGTKPRDPFKPIEETAEVLKNLSIVSIYLPNIQSFIKETYEMCLNGKARS